MEITMRINGAEPDTDNISLKLSRTGANVITGEQGRTTYSATVKLQRSPVNDAIFAEYIAPWAYPRTSRFNVDLMVGGIRMQGMFIAKATVTPKDISLNIIDAEAKLSDRVQPLGRVQAVPTSGAWGDRFIIPAVPFIKERTNLDYNGLPAIDTNYYPAYDVASKLFDWTKDMDGRDYSLRFADSYDTPSGAVYKGGLIDFSDATTIQAMDGFSKSTLDAFVNLTIQSVTLDTKTVSPSEVYMRTVHYDGSYNPNCALLYKAELVSGTTYVYRPQLSNTLQWSVDTRRCVLTDANNKEFGSTLLPPSDVPTTDALQANGRIQTGPVTPTINPVSVPAEYPYANALAMLDDLCKTFMWTREPSTLHIGDTAVNNTYKDKKDFASIGTVTSVDSISEAAGLANRLVALPAKTVSIPVTMGGYFDKATANAMESATPFVSWFERVVLKNDAPTTDIYNGDLRPSGEYLDSADYKNRVRAFLTPFRSGIQYTVSANIPFVNYADLMMSTVYYFDALHSYAVISSISEYDPDKGACKMTLLRYEPKE